MQMQEIEQLHKRSKERVNLEYVRKSGKVGYCYIDPNQPLTTQNHLLKGVVNPPSVRVGVYKCSNNVLIYVDPETLRFQNQKKAVISKVLYGT